MKRNEQFMLREVAGEQILIPVGEATRAINGLITLNPTAVFIWNHIENCKDADEMVALMLDHFEGDEAKIEDETRRFLAILLEKHFILQQ